MKYTKRPADFPEQLLNLKERGMLITNESEALELLGSISYFRLANYWHSKKIDTGSDNHRFVPNTHFEDVIDLYLLDEELRALIFTAIQNIEIALRTRIIHYFSMKWGSFWYIDESLFKNGDIYKHCIVSLKNELDRSKEDFIQEHFAKYDYPKFPPVWKALEIVSFGMLSKLYCNMQDTEVKKKVAKSFCLPQYTFLENWIKAASVLRNCCAHHARLWNRRFPVIPKLPQELPLPWITNNHIRPMKLYAQLCYLAYMELSIIPNRQFRKRLLELLSNQPRTILKAMGFPEKWQSEPLWN